MAVISVANIGFDDVTMDEAVERIVRMVNAGGPPRHVCTGNLDHLVLLQCDPTFRMTYDTADLVLADGAPVVWLSRLTSRIPLRERVAGSDLFWELGRVSAETGLRIFYMGGVEGSAERAADVVRQKFPGAQICGTYCPPYETFFTDAEQERIISEIRRAAPDVLLVGLGAPKQEKWIVANKARLGVPVSVGVGGSFEMAAGILKRAPLWMQKTGMEWLWRMLQEPKRLWRRYLLRDLPFFTGMLLCAMAMKGVKDSHGGAAQAAPAAPPEGDSGAPRETPIPIPRRPYVAPTPARPTLFPRRSPQMVAVVGHKGGAVTRQRRSDLPMNDLYYRSSYPLAYRVADSFFRQRKLFWAALLGVTAFSMLALCLRSQTYTATAMTRVASDSIASALGENRTSDTAWISPAQRNVNAFNDLIADDLPDGFLQKVLAKAQLVHPINVSPAANDPRLKRLRSHLTATALSDNMFAINLTWDDRGECQRIVTALQQEHIAENVQFRQTQARSTAAFLTREVGEYAQRMRRAEQALIDYKQNNAGQLPEAQSADISQLSTLRTQYDGLQITSRDNALRRAAIVQRMARLRPVSVMEQTIGDSPSMKALQDLQVKRVMLMADGAGPDNYRVKNVDDQIASLKAAVERERQAAVAAAATKDGAQGSVLQTKLQDNPEYNLLSQQLTEATIAQQTQQARMQLLKQQIAQYEDRVRRMPVAQRALADRTRDYNILKEQYESLLRRREEAQVKLNLDNVSEASMLIPIGTVYAVPMLGKSKLAIMFAGSLVLGLVVGAGLILLSEWNDGTLRYQSDVERLLDVPFLTAVPDSPRLIPTHRMIASSTGAPVAMMTPVVAPTPPRFPTGGQTFVGRRETPPASAYRTEESSDLMIMPLTEDRESQDRENGSSWR